MLKTDFHRRLGELDRMSIYVLTRQDIEKLFPDERDKAMEKSLQRMVAEGVLTRAARGLYVNPAASTRNRWIAEEIARALRPDALCYVSLESMLSEYGAISQIPVDRLTVMTTGRRGVHATPFGTIEFTHTSRPRSEIIEATLAQPGRPLRIATRATAARDLRRVGRNTNLIVDDGEDPDLDEGAFQ